ncbi:hypothetical protein MOQ72_41430 [Saccharopolyspora sp. K220]|uniref:hypothetical protein n=1 Tax=Saccharopolyspora soli TaxID=2926618 RepID=UPI001F5650E9|nr:hypothetical protein [Saccharopolyspora soli]MCI2423882.1 hypothetical protein [Saccharopolyspora soli]
MTFSRGSLMVWVFRVAYMGLAYDPTWSESEVGEDEEVQRRRFLALAAASAGYGVLGDPVPAVLPVAEPVLPARIGAVDVEALEAVAAGLRDLDQRCGGGLVRSATVALADHVRRLLNVATASATVQHQLLALLARCEGQAAWAALDLGDRGECRTRWDRALAAADQAADRPLIGHVLYGAARSELHHGEAAAALKLLQLAELSARGSRQRALLAANAAWASAMLPAPEAARRRIAEAREAHPADDGEATWLSWFQQADLLAVTGAAHAALGDWDAALEDTTAALRHRQTTEHRPIVFETTTLAVAHLHAGDHEAGQEAGCRALELAQGLRSARVADRLTPLQTVAAASRRSDVRDLGRRVAQYRARYRCW